MGRQKRQSDEARFWSWFADNSGDLLAVRTGREPIIEALDRELARVAEGLCFEFGPVRDGRREFIVSADGVKDRFAAVRRLVALAPELPAWQVIAFRPPKPMGDHVLRYGDIEISGDDVWFTCEAAGRRIDLELYVRGLDEADHARLAAPVFVLLDGTLGEYVVETRVGAMGWHTLPDEPANAGLRPFRELSAAVALPIRDPVSLLDALGESADPPQPPDQPRPDERWSLLEVRHGDEVSVVGLREGLLDHAAGLGYEVLVRVRFNAPSDKGMPDANELPAARTYGEWATQRLRASQPVEQALHMTGDGVRDLYLYCADPEAAVRVWAAELRPAIHSHEVAFYVRHSPTHEVYRTFAEPDGADPAALDELESTAGEFLAASLADHREMLDEFPGLWLGVHLFAFGAARAAGEAEGLSRREVLGMAYSLLVHSLGTPAEDATAAMRWIIDHESNEPVAAIIAAGGEAFSTWRDGEGGAEKLGEMLAEMGRPGEDGTT